MALPIVLMAAGTALSIWGIHEQSQAQARAARLDANLRDKQAKEVIERAQLNVTALLQNEGHLVGTQVSQFAKSGIDVGGQAPLLVQAFTIQNSRRQIYNTLREAQFRANMIRAGASSQRDLAKDIIRSGQLSMFGTLFSRAGSYGMSQYDSGKVASGGDFGSSSGGYGMGGSGGDRSYLTTG